MWGVFTPKKGGGVPNRGDKGVFLVLQVKYQIPPSGVFCPQLGGGGCPQLWGFLFCTRALAVPRSFVTMLSGCSP